MRSDRRWLFAMLVFVVICLSVPLWAPQNDEQPQPPEPQVAAMPPAPLPEVIAPKPVVATEPAKIITPPPPKMKSPPKEAFYVTLFAADPPSNLARESHVFATFVRTTTEGDNETLDRYTISWMPASLAIVPLRGPETGKNLSLEETFDWAKTVNARLVAWGPYEVKKELFESGRKQHDRLNKGEVMYKMLDVRFRPDVATNCIHAVCDVAPADFILLTGSAFGESAGWMVANHFRPWLVDIGKTHDFLTNHLGLRSREIAYRKLEPIAEVAGQ